MSYYEFKESDAWDFSRSSGITAKQKGEELQFLSCPYCRGGEKWRQRDFFYQSSDGAV